MEQPTYPEKWLNLRLELKDNDLQENNCFCNEIKLKICNSDIQPKNILKNPNEKPWDNKVKKKFSCIIL